MALDTAPLAPCLTMRLTGAMSSAPYLEGQTRGENSGCVRLGLGHRFAAAWVRVRAAFGDG